VGTELFHVVGKRADRQTDMTKLIDVIAVSRNSPHPHPHPNPTTTPTPEEETYVRYMHIQWKKLHVWI